MEITKYALSPDEAYVNGRIKYIPDDNGVYQPYEILCFERSAFLIPGVEVEKKKKIKYKQLSFFGEYFGEEEFEPSERLRAIMDAENRRKSYSRAKNKLFDILTCTISFDCFVTLTVSAEHIDRYDYAAVVKKLGQWLDNRVRRSELVYALVPELHKDGAIHFHGLMNMGALKLDRALSPYTGKPLFDDSGREIYNIIDFPLGFTTVIPLSGDNARIATAKYCYKYITKSGGEKVGGRYYLSGGRVGRPRYEYCNIDYDSIDSRPLEITDFVKVKKVRF